MNIENVLLWLECMQRDVCATDQCRHALFHSKSRINQILPQVVHILGFFLVDSLPHTLK